MPTTYRAQQFAPLAGVTVKTLHHYDRLGLLRPQRTASGYRVYRESDLQRLAQISALKLVGIPLKGIGPLLDGESRPLGQVLLSQRQVLNAKQQVIARAIDAIDQARRHLASGASADADVLRTLIEAIEMQSNVDVLKAYFDDAAWERWRQRNAEWPGAEWRALLREIEGRLDLDPSSVEAGTLAERWNDLAKRDAAGDVGVRTGFMKAWREWAMRPETRPPQLAPFDMDRILPFIIEAADAVHERRRLGSPETARVPPRVSASRLALFRDVASALGTDPAAEVGKQLARRYDALLDAETGGDADMKAEMRRAWTYRPTWPKGALRWIASLYDMDTTTWVAAAEYLRHAAELHVSG